MATRSILLLLFIAGFQAPCRSGEATYQGRTLAEWAELLAEQNPAPKTKAIAAIKSFGAAGRAALPKLAIALGDDDPEVRTQSAALIQELGAGGQIDKDFEGVVLDVLDKSVTPEILSTLKSIAASSGRYIDHLKNLLPRDDIFEDLLIPAIHELARTAPKDPEALRKVASLVGRNSEELFKELCKVLSAVGPGSIDALAPFTGDADPPTRNRAFQALGIVLAHQVRRDHEKLWGRFDFTPDPHFAQLLAFIWHMNPLTDPCDPIWIANITTVRSLIVEIESSYDSEGVLLFWACLYSRTQPTLGTEIFTPRNLAKAAAGFTLIADRNPDIASYDLALDLFRYCVCCFRHGGIELTARVCVEPVCWAGMIYIYRKQRSPLEAEIACNFMTTYLSREKAIHYFDVPDPVAGPVREALWRLNATPKGLLAKSTAKSFEFRQVIETLPGTVLEQTPNKNAEGFQAAAISEPASSGLGVAGEDAVTSRGCFGQRNGSGRMSFTQLHGGSESTERGVEAALRWLAYHQEADGHWDTVKYSSGQKTDTACTGFALLAFLGAGHSEKFRQYKDNVKRAVTWLRSKQQANGLLFDLSDAGDNRGYGYPHAIAGQALVEAAGMARVPETIVAAQKAISYSIEIHQQGEGSEKGAWRYAAKSVADLSVTGWYIVQLKSAKVAGLKVNPASFEGAIKFLDAVEVKGGEGHRYCYQPGKTAAHRVTAIGCLSRHFMGWKRDDLQGGVDWFVRQGGVPEWGPDGGSVDLYFWYWGTLCTFQQGGDIWKRWNDSMKKALVDNQRKGGDEDGSWDPVGAYAGEWGRVGQTALACLCLEVYYRYPRVHADQLLRK